MGVGTNYNYKANHYTGANVSVMMGPSLLTECFGIVWSLQQNKRPIYGYNDQYFSAMADGTVSITGQLFINYTHTDYLSTVMQRYWQFVQTVRSVSSYNSGSELVNYFATNQILQPLVNVIRDNLDPALGIARSAGARRAEGYSYTPIGVLNQHTDQPTVDSEISMTLENTGINDQEIYLQRVHESQQALDTSLNAVFENDEIRADLIQFFTGGLNVVTSSTENAAGTTSTTSVFTGDGLGSLHEHNLEQSSLGSVGSNSARPDQFGSAAGGPNGIDIRVHFGPPYGLGEQNQILNYMEKSSFTLKDVHFVGESGEVTMNDQPLMEVYTFIARKKESLLYEEVIHHGN